MPVSKSESSFDINRPKRLVIEKILQILEYQYGKSILKGIFSDENSIGIEYSRKTGKIKYVFHNGKRLLSYKPRVGLFSISVSGAVLLHNESTAPDYRVRVLSEIEDYIKEGKSVFSKHVVEMDRNLRMGNDVLVVNEMDELIGVGKLTVPPVLYKGRPTGVAVSVRKGINGNHNKNTKKI